MRGRTPSGLVILLFSTLAAGQVDNPTPEAQLFSTYACKARCNEVGKCCKDFESMCGCASCPQGCHIADKSDTLASCIWKCHDFEETIARGDGFCTQFFSDERYTFCGASCRNNGCMRQVNDRAEMCSGEVKSCGRSCEVGCTIKFLGITTAPTMTPTLFSNAPTESPMISVSPTVAPTWGPLFSTAPTEAPTRGPLASDESLTPTEQPTGAPFTQAPTATPTAAPTSPTVSPTTPTSKPTPGPSFGADVIDAKIAIACAGGGSSPLANSLRGSLAVAVPGGGASMVSLFPDLSTVSVMGTFTEDTLVGFYPERASPYEKHINVANRWPGMYTLTGTLRLCDCSSCSNFTFNHAKRLRAALMILSGAAELTVDQVSAVSGGDLAPCTAAPAIDVELRLFSTASAVPTPAPTVPRLQNLGLNCWANCSAAGGPCLWCGWDGLCCRLARPDIGQKWVKQRLAADANSCGWDYGCLRKHCCAAPTQSPTISPTATPTTGPTFAAKDADDAIFFDAFGIARNENGTIVTRPDRLLMPILKAGVYDVLDENGTVIGNGTDQMAFVFLAAIIDRSAATSDDRITIMHGRSGGGYSLKGKFELIGYTSLSTVQFDIIASALASITNSKSSLCRFDAINSLPASVVIHFSLDSRLTWAPTNAPSAAPTFAPTFSPTTDPTSPSFAPTNSPTDAPSNPTTAPSFSPTSGPSFPTEAPTFAPTYHPSTMPTVAPTAPTFAPTTAPTVQPTWAPTVNPTTALYHFQHTILTATTFNPDRGSSPLLDSLVGTGFYPNLQAVSRSEESIPDGIWKETLGFSNQLGNAVGTHYRDWIILEGGFEDRMPSAADTLAGVTATNAAQERALITELARIVGVRREHVQLGNQKTLNGKLNVRFQIDTIWDTYVPSTAPTLKGTVVPTAAPSVEPTAKPTEAPTDPTYVCDDSLYQFGLISAGIIVFGCCFLCVIPLQGLCGVICFRVCQLQRKGKREEKQLARNMARLQELADEGDDDAADEIELFKRNSAIARAAKWTKAAGLVGCLSVVGFALVLGGVGLGVTTNIVWHPDIICTGFDTPSPTLLPTMLPTMPTVPDTESPTRSPSVTPTVSPTYRPTQWWESPNPTHSPTNPTPVPTRSPTRSPSFMPTAGPTQGPTGCVHLGYPDAYVSGDLCGSLQTADQCAYGGESDPCRDCPRGCHCPGGDRCFALPGFYSDDEKKTDLRACKAPRRIRCLGWNPKKFVFEEKEEVNGTMVVIDTTYKGGTTCGPAFRGMLCERCNKGYFQEYGTCIPCPTTDYIGIFVIPISLMMGFAIGTGAFVFAVVAVILVLKWKWRDGDKPTVGEIYGNVGPFVASCLSLLQLLATAAAQTQGDLPAWLRQFYSLLKMVLVQTPGTNPQCMEDENANPFIMDMVIMCNAFVVLTLCVLFMSHPFRVETHLRRCWMASREYGRCWLCKCINRRKCPECADAYELRWDPYCERRCVKVEEEAADPYALDMSLYGQTKSPVGSDADGSREQEQIFELGAQVEARYMGGDSWFSAVVIDVHDEDNTYDVIYEDGDTDERIPSSWIRLIIIEEAAIVRENPHKSRAPPPQLLDAGAEVREVDEGTEKGGTAADNEASLSSMVVVQERIYAEGDIVDAKYLDGTTWFRGTILSVNAIFGEDTSYRVRYEEDGEEEDGMPSSAIRFIKSGVDGDELMLGATNPLFKQRHPRADAPSPQPLSKAEQKRAEKAQKKAVKAEKRAAAVAAAAAKKTARKEVAAAKREAKRAKRDGAKKKGGKDEETFSHGNPLMKEKKKPLRVGDAIECRFSGGSDWYSGHITACHQAGDDGADAEETYDVTFDDGDTDTNVSKDCVRRVLATGGVEASGSSSSSSSSGSGGSSGSDSDSSGSSSGSDSEEEEEEEEAVLVGPDTLFVGDLVDTIDHDGVLQRATVSRSQLMYLGKTVMISYDIKYVKSGEEAWELERDALTRVELPFIPTGGMEVEGNFAGKGEWFAATIDYVHETDVYDVEYEDGEYEDKVVIERLRKRRRYGARDLPMIIKLQAYVRGQGGRHIYAQMRLDQGAKAKIARLRRKSFMIASEVAGQISENLPGPLEMLAPAFIAAQGMFDAAGQEREADDEPFIVNLFEEIITPGIRMLLCAIPMMEYSTITQKCLDTLHCVESPEHGLILAAQAKPIRCWEGIHVLPAGIAICAIIIYGIGFPLFTLCHLIWTLLRKRKELERENIDDVVAATAELAELQQIADEEDQEAMEKKKQLEDDIKAAADAAIAEWAKLNGYDYRQAKAEQDAEEEAERQKAADEKRKVEEEEKKKRKRLKERAARKAALAKGDQWSGKPDPAAKKEGSSSSSGSNSGSSSDESSSDEGGGFESFGHENPLWKAKGGQSAEGSNEAEGEDGGKDQSGGDDNDDDAVVVGTKTTTEEGNEEDETAAAALEIIVLTPEERMGILATHLHEVWRDGRKLKNGSYTQAQKIYNRVVYDIAALTFDELPEPAKELLHGTARCACEYIENALTEPLSLGTSRSSALASLVGDSDFVEGAAALQHAHWRKKADRSADSTMLVPYAHLTEPQKEQSRFVIASALEQFVDESMAADTVLREMEKQETLDADVAKADADGEYTFKEEMATMNCVKKDTVTRLVLQRRLAVRLEAKGARRQVAYRVWFAGPYTENTFYLHHVELIVLFALNILGTVTSGGEPDIRKDIALFAGTLILVLSHMGLIMWMRPFLDDCKWLMAAKGASDVMCCQIAGLSFTARLAEEMSEATEALVIMAYITMGMFVASVIWTLITFSWMLYFEVDFTTEVIRVVKAVINSRKEAVRARAAMTRAAQFSAVTAAEEAYDSADYSARVAHAHVVALVTELACDTALSATQAAEWSASRARRSITEARQMKQDILSGKKLKPLKRMSEEMVTDLRALRKRFTRSDEASSHLMKLHQLKKRQRARMLRVEARKQKGSSSTAASAILPRDPTYFEAIRLEKQRMQAEIVALRDRYKASERNQRAMRRIANAKEAKEAAAAAKKKKKKKTT